MTLRACNDPDDDGSRRNNDGDGIDALWSKMEKKHRINSHLIIHCPMSERCERTSEQTSEWPSTQSVFLVILDHSVNGAGLIRRA